MQLVNLSFGCVSWSVGTSRCPSVERPVGRFVGGLLS